MQSTTVKRIFATFIELQAIMVLAILFFFVWDHLTSTSDINDNIFHAQSTLGFGSLPALLFGAFSLLCLKDVLPFGGLLKYLMALRVIDLKSGHLATPVQRVVRNLTLFLSPLELFVLLFSKSGRRLGDYLAGTAVVDKNNVTSRIHYHFTDYLRALLIGILLNIPTLFLYWYDAPAHQLASFKPRERDSVLSERLTQQTKDYFRDSALSVSVDYYNRSERGLQPLMNIFVRLNNKRIYEEHQKTNYLAATLLALGDSIVPDTNYNAFLDLRYHGYGTSSQYSQHLRLSEQPR